jgi:hypothetical protein
MKIQKYILLIAGALFFVSAELMAQDSANVKKNDNDAINTNDRTPIKLIESIVGKWKVQTIYKGKKNITNLNSEGANQMIEFNREGRFVRQSNAAKIDSGAYRLNENQNSLYLESELRKEPVEYKVYFNRNTMTLKIKGTAEGAETYSYVYSRNGNSTRANN